MHYFITSLFQRNANSSLCAASFDWTSHKINRHTGNVNSKLMSPRSHSSLFSLRLSPSTLLSLRFRCSLVQTGCQRDRFLWPASPGPPPARLHPDPPAARRGRLLWWLQHRALRPQLLPVCTWRTLTHTHTSFRVFCVSSLVWLSTEFLTLIMNALTDKSSSTVKCCSCPHVFALMPKALQMSVPVFVYIRLNRVYL